MDKEQEKAAKARDAALSGALGQIERQFGKGSIMRMGDEDAAVRVDAISSGALSLDIALGVGGLPRGRIVEIFGPESSGKTTLLYHLLAEAQKMGGICAFIDAEHAMDPTYAKHIGVDIDNPSSRSPIPASRRSRSPSCSSAPARSTWSPSTRSQR